MARTGGRISGRDFSPRPTGELAPSPLSTLIGVVDTPWGFSVDFETGTVEASYNLSLTPFVDFLNTKVTLGINLAACVGWVRLSGNLFGIPNDGAVWQFPLDTPACRDKPPKLKCNDYRNPTERCIDWVDYYINGDPNLPAIDFSEIGVLIWLSGGSGITYHYFEDGGEEEVIAERTQTIRNFYGLGYHLTFDIELEDWIAAINKEKKIELCHIAYGCWFGLSYEHSYAEGGPGRIFGDCGKFEGSYGRTIETPQFWEVIRNPPLEFFDGENYNLGFLDQWTMQQGLHRWRLQSNGYLTPPAINHNGGPDGYFPEMLPDYIEVVCETLYLKSNSPGRPRQTQNLYEREPFVFPNGEILINYVPTGPSIPWGPAEPIDFPPPAKTMPRKCCSCDDIRLMLKPIYEFLGFNRMTSGSVTLDPDKFVRLNGLLCFDRESKESQETSVRDIFDLVGAIASAQYMRAGYQDLPAKVPKTLFSYSDDDKPEQMNDQMSYFVWFVKQFDALLGQWPIEIEIEDIDPTTSGKQTKKIEMPNVSEALAEVYGLSVESTVNSDIAISFLMRLAAEMLATKNSSLITQDYVKANAEYLGYKGNPVKREVQYAFNPQGLGNLEKILEEKMFKIVGWENKDRNSVAAYLANLQFAAGIIKEVFYRTGKSQNFAELLNKFTAESNDEREKDWEDFLELINYPDSYLNREKKHPWPRLKEKNKQDDQNDPNA